MGMRFSAKRVVLMERPVRRVERKRMLSYPSIEGSSKAPLGKPCIAFYKYDGSNLRFEWQRKGRQWMKYGTRTQLFNATTPTFGPAISVFHGTASEDMA